MSKHTPGPWTWYPTGMDRERMASVSIVGSHNHTPYVSHADARLICAAPEMLALLREAEGIFAHGLEDEHECVDLWRRISDVIATTEPDSVAKDDK